MNNNTSTWQLFKSVLITEGASRGIIQDVQRGKYYTVPLSLIEYINNLSSSSLESILSSLDSSETEIAQDYMSFLINNQIIFECPNDLLGNFPKISTEYDFPAHISNAIIEISNFSIFEINEIIEQLSKLLCFNLVIIIKCNITKLKLDEILKVLDKMEPNDVEFVLNHHLDLDFSNLKSNHNYLTSFTFFTNKIESDNKYINSLELNIIYTDKDFTNHKYCGAVDSSYFSLGLNHYSESQKYNTCLNRKIAVDSEGNIKNCLGMTKSYGNIKDTKLVNVVKNSDFQKVWHIKKDEIIKCKDCEFRHICTDCRAYIENPEDQYSAPLKCGYNPYTCEWDEWIKNPLKQKAIEFYGMHELVK